MNALVLLALLFPDPWVFDQSWRLVYPGRVEAVSGPLVPAAVEASELRGVWFWSSTAAPQRLEPNELEDFTPPRDAGRLHLRVASEEELPASARVLAGPEKLWREVPESLLPSWRVPANRLLELPRRRGEAWRCRLVEKTGSARRGPGGLGTWWSALRPGQASGALVPLPARDLRVEVLGEDGLAIPGARIEALAAEAVRSRKSTFLAWARAETERGTEAAVVPALPDSAELTLLVAAEGYVPATFQGLPSTLPARVELVRGAGLRGRFVDADGEPVEGVEVRLEAWLAGDFAAYVVRGARSLEDGTFTIGAVPAGKAVVRAHSPGYAVYHAEVEVASEDEAEDHDLGEILLEREADLVVLVVDETGEPVAGAELRPRPGERVRTGEDGRAALRGVGPSRGVDLAVDAHGYEPNERRLVPPHPPLVEVRLDRAFLVRGRFLDSEGLPVPAGRFRATAGVLGVHGTVTGGEIDLELPAGKAFELALTSPHTAEVRLLLDPGLPGEERDLGDVTAPAGHRLEGLLVSAADTSPVAGARVWLPRPSARGHDLEAWFFGDLVETVSASDGTFTLTGLPVRDLRLTIDAPGFARRTLDVRPDPEAPSTDLGEVELRAGSTLHVVAPAELPPGAFARVDLGNRWLETDMLRAPFSRGDLGERVATFRHVPPGEVTVSAVDRDRLLCEARILVAEEDGEREVTCRRNAVRVTGVVRVAGRPAGPGRLVFLPPAPEHPSFIERGETPRGLGRARIYGAGRPQVDVDVEAGGAFASDELAPGAWTVSWLASSGAVTASRDVRIPEAEEVELALDFPGRAVSGDVRDADGLPVAGARVRDLVSGTVAQSEADGGFSLLGLEPGRHWLRAERRDSKSAAVAVDLDGEIDPEPVRLVLGTDGGGAEVEVRVAGEASGAFVFLEAEGRSVRVLTADASGRAALAFDPPYPSRIRAAAHVGGVFVLGGWQAFTEASQTPVLLEAESSPGALVIAGSGTAPFVPRIVSATGWDLSWLLTRLGRRPAAGPDAVRIEGLPPGVYEVSASGARRFANVSAGGEARIELDPAGTGL